MELFGRRRDGHPSPSGAQEGEPRGDLWEYRVVPAPGRPVRRRRGLHATEERFARAVEEMLNDMASRGWEFIGSESLPCEEGRRRLTIHALLVFRRRRGAWPPEPGRENGARRGLLARLGLRRKDEPVKQHEAPPALSAGTAHATSETSGEGARKAPADNPSATADESAGPDSPGERSPAQGA